MAVDISPHDKAHELARAITGSDAYKKYVAAKAGVEGNPEYQELIMNIRNLQMRVNQDQLLGQEVQSGVVLELSRLFAEANQIDDLAEFFGAEGAFIQVFNDVIEILQKAVKAGLE